MLEVNNSPFIVKIFDQKLILCIYKNNRTQLIKGKKGNL